MPLLTAPPLPAGCPWSGWTPPNVDWCEAQRCAWVVNPADTWSNLAYVVLGVLMVVSVRRHPPRGRLGLSLFGPASIGVGIFSGVYHASYTYFFQFFDFVGMFVFCFAVITANALRLGWVERPWPFYAGGVALMSALVPVVGETRVPIQSLVLVLILAIVGQEVALAVRRRPDEPAPPYALFGLALLAMGVAAAASLADVTRGWCDPDSVWLQGHAVWHVLSAAALFALFYFYRGIESGGVGLTTARRAPARSPRAG